MSKTNCLELLLFDGDDDDDDDDEVISCEELAQYCNVVVVGVVCMCQERPKACFLIGSNNVPAPTRPADAKDTYH